ncbi:MAG TPA: hypothetical protein VKZ63_03390, partial [Kofleriaceae bacterium]|nr:hypothetical protein [Kofleriaceae bacterium]
ASAQQGGPLSIALRARSPEDESIAAELERPLYVVGAPGSIDPTFGEGGVASLSIEPGADYVSVGSIALDGEGRLLVAGTIVDVEQSESELALVRLSGSGEADPEFAGGEVIRTTVGGAQSNLWAMVSHDDGKVVLAALVPGTGMVLRRYTAAGQVDDSFGASGDVTLDDPGRLAARGDELVVAEEKSVILLDAAGRIDTSFHATSPLEQFPDSIAIGPDGGILLGGGTDGFRLARLLPSGEPDREFGVLSVGAVDGSPDDAQLLAIAPSAAGGMAVGKVRYDDLFMDVGHVLKYTAAGDLDQGFGAGGVLALGELTSAIDVAIDAEGRGLVLVRGSGGWSLWRLLPGGEVDPAFGDGGAVSLGETADKVGVRMIHEPVAERLVVCSGSHTGALTCSRLWL